MNPSGHAVHDAEPDEAANVPAGHVLQYVDPTEAEPAGHGVHAVPPELFEIDPA
jgi:hypothetical protein